MPLSKETYIEIRVILNGADPLLSDIVTFHLSEAGFDMFRKTDQGLATSLPANKYSKGQVEEALSPWLQSGELSYEAAVVPQENWNEAWEKSYHPVTIAGKIHVRASFHAALGDSTVMDVLINPKMSFGTGHHETTSLMIAQMAQMDFNDKTTLDFGCGTGILSILAHKMGARKVLGLDNDPQCMVNSLENALLNGIQTGISSSVNYMNGQLDDLDPSTGQKNAFDIILANINRNVILQNLKLLMDALKKEGQLLASGFYVGNDADMLISKASEAGLSCFHQSNAGNWALLGLRR